MDAQTLCRQAVELHKRGDSGGAERFYLQALAIEPGNFAALHLLGVLRSQLGRKSEALELIAAALRVKPDAPAALMNQALLLEEMQRPEDALASFDRVLAVRPDFASAHFSRANTLRDMGRLEEALSAYDRAVALRPPYIEALNNRAGVQRALSRVAEALASYEAAIAVTPDSAILWKNRGNILRELNRFEEALASYDKALAIYPDDAPAWDDRGAALHALRRFDEAMASFERAAAIDTDYAPAHFHRSLGFLQEGRLPEGWPLWEWRQKLPAAARRNLPGPRWTGAEEIAGKTLFIWWEEGLGDVIQFFRYARLAAARGAKVIFSAPDCLQRLLAGKGVEIIGPDHHPPQFDYHIPLLSLPLAFSTGMQTIPAEVPYLTAEPERVKHWGQTLGDAGFRIGIVWATATSRSLGRSFPLAALEDVAKLPGVRLISLQKNDGLEQLSQLPPGMQVEIPAPTFDEGSDAFVDTAAIMQNLDLVITADTATAHLAGALGRPVWLALKYAADWRWFLDRADSPWYPTARLFRHTSDGDWAGVFAQMKAELARR